MVAMSASERHSAKPLRVGHLARLSCRSPLGIALAAARQRSPAQTGERQKKQQYVRLRWWMSWEGWIVLRAYA